MKIIKLFFLSISLLILSTNCYSQCNQILTINNCDAICNGDGTSTVTIEVSILFGNGNNSAVISYNLGSGEVSAVVIEDDNGDIINQTYIFNVPSCDNYMVALTGWTNPAGSGSSCNNSQTAPVILPVKFGYFEVTKEGRNILLEWSTHTETNNEKFVIQRADENGTFIKTGEVSGAVNSHAELHYEFLDRNVSDGIYYYRLMQIDLDGQFSFSEVRASNVKGNSDLLVYPNPASENITISTSKSNIFKVVDIYGKVITTLHKTDSVLRYDISQLVPGMYHLQSMEGSENVSFIKL